MRLLLYIHFAAMTDSPSFSNTGNGDLDYHFLEANQLHDGDDESLASYESDDDDDEWSYPAAATSSSLSLPFALGHFTARQAMASPPSNTVQVPDASHNLMQRQLSASPRFVPNSPNSDHNARWCNETIPEVTTSGSTSTSPPSEMLPPSFGCVLGAGTGTGCCVSASAARPPLTRRRLLEVLGAALEVISEDLPPRTMMNRPVGPGCHASDGSYYWSAYQ